MVKAKSFLILTGVTCLFGCSQMPGAPVSIGDNVYGMRIGARTGTMALEEGNEFCASKGRKLKLLKMWDNGLEFACLAPGEQMELRAPTQRIEIR